MLLACAGGTPAVEHPEAVATPRERGALAGLGDPYAHASDRGCTLTPIYFSYDSNDLGLEARDALSRVAGCLKARGSGGDTRTVLVGMTDPRGTEEYNLALGDRRARSAMSYLASLGVDTGAIDARSLGEEQATGRDETGWARDRRVEVVP